MYGVIEEVKFRHWAHMPTVGDGVRIVRMVRREAIPRHMSIGEVRVKIAYAGQQQVCDLCDAPGHIARNCPYRNKCFQCGLEGHFSRNCPQLANYRDRDSVLDELDPTPAEAAGRAVSAAGAAAAVPSESTDAPPRSDADSLDGVSVSSALVASATGTALDADIDLSDSELTPTVGSTPSPPSDARDNQLDELASQSLLSSLAPTGADGATIESAGFDSPASPSSPGQAPPPSPMALLVLGSWVKLNKGLGCIKRRTLKLLTMLMLVMLVMESNKKIVVILRHLLVMAIIMLVILVVMQRHLLVAIIMLVTLVVIQ